MTDQELIKQMTDQELELWIAECRKNENYWRVKRVLAEREETKRANRC